MNENNNVGMVLMTILFILFILYPLGIAWSLNHLFGLGLEYNVKTWLAVILLTTVFASKVKVDKNK